MSTCDAECIWLCCPCLVVWAGVYFGVRGAAHGCVFCYHRCRRACCRGEGSEADSDSEIGHARDERRPNRDSSEADPTQWGARVGMQARKDSQPATLPYDVYSGEKVPRKEEKPPQTEKWIQSPPSAVPSMKVVSKEHGTHYEKPRRTHSLPQHRRDVQLHAEKRSLGLNADAELPGRPPRANQGEADLDPTGSTPKVEKGILRGPIDEKLAVVEENS
ncbi:hypothetical protein FA15DRAFT_667609 [Coprinopsis marcescibilis]|uniref:Uncharacterized protein n=1 Tax=Coprinopsis marcescibilis TaxID=230819 RepID=A0A5C3LD28_COPMA|nr:hypothetical protein FA15DRAFT_667609 [Coprinopsis marcescibilis]